MKIALCDDEKRDLDILTEYCRRYDETLSVTAFPSAAALLDAFERDFYELVFLDIEMPEPNGYTVGKELSQREHPPVIVFTTQTLGYAVRGYGIALRYLPKPIDYPTFAGVMRLAIDRILPKKLVVTLAGEKAVLPVNDILYCESQAHTTVFSVKGGAVLEAAGAFREYAEALLPNRFAQPHRCYCVNLRHIDRISSRELIMTDGKRIPISRKRRDAFMALFDAHMRGLFEA